MPLRNNRIGIYRKYNAVITYRNVLPNIMRAIAPVLFVISLESLFFLNRVRPLRFTNLDYLNKLTKLDLLVIDDFGLMDLDLDKCRDLFEVLDTRDGRKSTVVISQFPVSTWFDMFADNTYADACLTRITDKHHTYRLEMNGINMRETE